MGRASLLVSCVQPFRGRPCSQLRMQRLQVTLILQCQILINLLRCSMPSLSSCMLSDLYEQQEAWSWSFMYHGRCAAG